MDKSLLEADYHDIVAYLKKAGSNNAEHFGTEITGGLEIQQVPEEYAKLLMWLRDTHIDSYLAIGIGNGGSFLLEVFMMQNHISQADAIDNISYTGICNQSKEDIESRIKEANEYAFCEFYNGDSKDELKEQARHGYQYDAIFIDGDHSYEGVRDDFLLALKLKPKYIIMHDIASVNCLGVVAWWNQIKNDKCIEFIHSDKCGIGIWTL